MYALLIYSLYSQYMCYHAIQCSTYYTVYTQLLQYVIVCVRVPKTYIVPLLSTLIRSDTSLGDWTTWRADGYSTQIHNMG